VREFRPFRLDPLERTLSRIGDDGALAPVPLTARAFDVLHFLVEHPGRLVTHDELLTTLWPDTDVQPEVVKAHVLAIRQALGDDARHPRFIETHRGRGYRFVAEVHGKGSSAPFLPAEDSPLIGREAPLAELVDLLAQARHGRPQMAFIGGEAGIGKTALAQRFAHDAQQAGALVSIGRCIEGFAGAEPFYPILDALARLAKGAHAHWIQPLLVTSAPSWAWHLGGVLTRERYAQLQKARGAWATSRMLGEFCDFLEAVAEQQPVLIWIDDLHWADYSSLDLLSAIARRRSRARTCIVGTWRTDEITASRAPLKALVDDLLLHQACRSLELGALSRAETAKYLGADDNDTGRAFADLLWQRSGGNPLFLEATLGHLEAAQLASHRHGHWNSLVAPGALRIEIPPTIAELVEARIARLDEESRRVLEAASAIGEVFDSIVPAAAAGLGPHRFEEVCEALSRTDTFIVRSGSDASHDGRPARQYRFRHALYRDAFLNRQGPLRLAHSHALIGREMERSPSKEAVAVHAAFALVDQFTRAREWAKSVEYLMTAVQTAKRRFAHRDALAMLDQADAIALNLPEQEREHVRAALIEDRASILAASHDPRSQSSFEELAALAERLRLPDLRCRAELGLAFVLSWRSTSDAVRHLERAAVIAEEQTDPQRAARTRLGSAAWQIWIGGWRADLAQICEANLRPLRNGPDRQIAAWGLVEYSMVCLVSSRYREALETIEANVDILTQHVIDRAEHNVFRAIWMVHLGRPWAYTLLGEWGRALDAFDVSETLFVGNGNRYGVCTLQTLKGFLSFLAGDFDGIKDICGRLAVHEDGREHDPLYTLKLPNEIRHWKLLSGIAEAGLGNAESALRYFRDVESDMTARPVVMNWYWRMMLEWGLADLMLRTDQVSEGRVHAQRMLEQAQRTQEMTWCALALEVSARAAGAQGDGETAIAHIDEALALVARVGASAVDWRVYRTAARLHRQAGATARADAYEALCRNAVHRIVSGLPLGSRLRDTFVELSG
jgi:DNA-binding winged helix-turn-helix (wHTH) protein/KaiC/GvpD/RAD55 family RecA-like ATPase